MQKELKKVKRLLNSPDKTNQELGLALVEGMNLNLQRDLPKYYATYKFLEKYLNDLKVEKQLEKGLEDTVLILKELFGLTYLELYFDSTIIEEGIIDFQLPNVRRLGIGGGIFLSGIPNFTGLVSLEYLTIRSCKIEQSIPNFTSIPNLISLSLEILFAGA